MTAKLTYTTAICTRNRPDALALTLPYHIAEARAPERVVIIDSSDDPSEDIATVERLAKDAPMPVEHITSESGLAYQRNLILPQLTTDVVFFPDDDSLIEPGAMEAVMRIYERDTEKRIAGVAPRELFTPIGPLKSEADEAYEKTTSDKIKNAIAAPRYKIEKAVIGDPFVEVANIKYARQPAPPAWLDDADATVVPWNTGFRMSFRTESIRRKGFHEPLGRYALFEDIDAGFQTLDQQILVTIQNVGIYHHKAPARRANGRALGAMHILNRAYVCARSGEGQNPKVRSAMKRFSLYKLAQYAVGARGDFGKERLQGARAASKVAGKLLTTPQDQLEARYLEFRTQIFTSE
ncbi:glycosyltransferase family 2 protein [Paracoccaceae bacterium GXU_MW_L88]